MKKGKKMSRYEHGRISVKDIDDGISIAAIKCQTDFLANSDLMKETLDKLCDIIPLAYTTDYPNSAPIANPSADLIEKLKKESKEDVIIWECKFYKYTNTLTTNYYIHHDNKKIGIVELSVNGLEELCKNIAMHIIAFSPIATTIDDIDWTDIDLEIPKNLKNKPEHIIEKIRKGKKIKYAKQHILMDQPFVKNLDKSVSQIIKEHNSSLNTDIKIKSWHRIEV